MITKITNKRNLKKSKYLYLTYILNKNLNKQFLLKHILIEINKINNNKIIKIPNNLNKIIFLIKEKIKTNNIFIYLFFKTDSNKIKFLEKIVYFLDISFIYNLKIIIILEKNIFYNLIKNKFNKIINKDNILFNYDLYNLLKNKKNSIRIYNIDNLINFYFLKLFKINIKNSNYKFKIYQKNIFFDICIKISNLKIINYKKIIKFNKKNSVLNGEILLNFLFLYILLIKYYSYFMYKKIIKNFKNNLFLEEKFKLNNDFKGDFNKILLTDTKCFLMPLKIYFIFFESKYIGTLKKYKSYYIYEIKYLQFNMIIKQIIKYNINNLCINLFMKNNYISEDILELAFDCIIKNSII